MPSPFTTSFASAASGNASGEGHVNGRNTGSGDWSRARPNGATATFRRPSSISTNQREIGQSGTNPPPSAGSAYVPPHMNPNYQSSFVRNGAGSETRYSKDQLLDMFKIREKSGPSSTNISELFVEGWAPSAVNGNDNGGWGKKEDSRDSIGTDICWDFNGAVRPVSLDELDDEEREIFSSSVNSVLKPVTNNKDGTGRESLNRRTSMTQSQNNTDSPTGRPGGRRRDSSDVLRSGNPMSPNNNRLSRDESAITSPPPSLLRRKTGGTDTFGPSLEDREIESHRPTFDSASHFGSLKRTSTNPVSTGLNGPSSPWSAAPQSAGFAPMGAFGAFGSMEGSSSEKKPGFGSVRGQSRFKGLMGAGGSEELSKPRAALDNLAESNSEQQSHQGLRWGPGRSVQVSKDLYDEDGDLPAGSAALGGDDASPPAPQTSRYRSLEPQPSHDDIGFSSLGLGSDMPQFQQRREMSHQQTSQRNSGLGQPHDPMSPTSTNPYQSPEGDRALPVNTDTEDDMHYGQYAGATGVGQGGRNVQSQLESHDRSQTSSTKGFPSLGGLGNLSGLGGAGPWSAAPGAIGTPGRAQAPQSAGFGDSFSPFGDLNSAGLGGAGFLTSGPPSSGNVGAIGGRSKLGALFPSAMQDQSLGDTRQDSGFGDNDGFQMNAPGFNAGLRDTDSPRLRGSKLEDILSSENRGQPGFSSQFEQDSNQPALTTPFSGASSSANFFTRSQEPDTPGVSSQLPASQQRQMVMPDRMRWIYRDPQGNTQGPWSGLEMHDWYKAGFFSPELQVKKLEDADYEPLAQLIRRIGNSREPFLVPQIGIPHGSSAPQPSAAATAPAATPSAAQSSSAQPPFASSFPSFGTTLTAEQQNALERRKQEEQYLMARQKEHLAQQQVLMKQMQHMQGGIHGQQLHHQSSGQSLHSQPSFGSITSPAYQPSPAQNPIQPPSVPGFFDGPPRNAGPLGADPLGSVREEDLSGLMDRMQAGRGAQPPFSGGQHGLDHQQQVNAMLQERARQQREQEQYDTMQHGDDPRMAAERLEQYRQLRAQEEEQLFQQQGPIGGGRHPGQQQQEDQYQERSQQSTEQRGPEHLSLSEQVQKAAAKQSPQTQQPQSPWAKVDTGMPQPFPPPQPSSPMPAPTPQRNRQSVADALNAESQSPSQTDSVETPSAAMAPWAKETTEGSKGPSLKEIQAMEAKQAAQQEEIQAATRRAMADQGRMSEKSQPAAPAPGLPSSANWASSVSPAIPTSAGASPWAKPTAGKPAVATPVSGTKKTLSQIQKEEEARKNRAAAAAAAAANTATISTNAPPMAGGKRYADLASKNAPPQNPNNAAWTTVGASGKVKTPAPAPGLNARPAASNVLPAPVVAAKAKAAAPSLARASSTQQNANDEFQKWTKNALSKGLNSGINVDGFITTLLDLPAEPEIISDSVYAASSTIDGRRFAEEFIRRRKLADRGVIPDSSASNFSANIGNENKNGGGGWNEVAKKGTTGTSGTEKDAPGFKVVSGKKKGGKR